MRPVALAVVVLLLAGCGGTISFRREEMAFLIDDERARYNQQAGFVNRACAAGALSPTECQLSADDAKEAVKQYQGLRARLLAKQTIDSSEILKWLLIIGAAIGRIYGIPIPSAATAIARPAAPTLPLMP
jgi:hypothetical protein